MGILSTKRVASLLAAGVSVAALASLPGSASAACTPITGQGATLQDLAQNRLWIPLSTGCNGNITYNPTSSGTGLTAWSANGAITPSADSYIATDEAPTASQITNMTTAAGSSIEVIPVAQAAVAVIVNLPANCVPSGAGSLRADPAALQDAYDSETATFWDLFPGQLRENVAGACRVLVRPYARNRDSGTTRIFKNYLNIADPGNWSGDTNGSVTWPAGSLATANATAGSGGALVDLVNANDGTIGYANLADALGRGLDNTPGANGFWVLLKSANGTWSDPRTGDDLSGYTSNCDSTPYSSAPTTTTNADWSSTYGVSLTATNYGMCALTFDIAYTKQYQRISSPARTFNQGDTASQYLQYVVSAIGGQLLLNTGNYAPLPGSIQTTAAAGAALVNTL